MVSIDISIIPFLSVQPFLGKILSHRLPGVLTFTFFLPPPPQSMAVDATLPNETKVEFSEEKNIALITCMTLFSFSFVFSACLGCGCKSRGTVVIL